MSDFCEIIRRQLRGLPTFEAGPVPVESPPALFPILIAGLQLVQSGRSLVVLTETMGQAEDLAPEVQAWLRLLGSDRQVILLPEFEAAKRQLIPEHECERSRVLDRTGRGPGLYVASIMAAVAPAPDPRRFRAEYYTLRTGSESWPPEKLAALLTRLDYDNEVEVRLPGEFSWRGGILDVFSPVYTDPIRLDYFGQELESIKFFDPETQRSGRAVEECLVIPRGESALREPDRYFSFPDYFDSAAVGVVMCRPPRLAEHVDTYGDQAEADCCRSLGDGRLPLVVLDETFDLNPAYRPPAAPLSTLFAAATPETEEHSQLLLKQLLHSTVGRWHRDGFRIGACCSSQSKLDRFREILHESEALRGCEPELIAGDIRGGVMFPDVPLVLLSEAEIFGVSKAAPPRRRPKPTFHADHLLHSTAELHAGDFVVHAAYGVGKFHGIRMAEFNGQFQEVLALEFADSVEVLVPLEQAYLVGRYVGTGKSLPKLSKVGGTRWKKARGEAELAVRDFAAELLRIQAVRATSKGVSFQGEEELLEAFGDAFPYTETPDQHTAIEQVYADMEAVRPMDRLLCGDVGFGKTEVAMRAAFKAIAAGKQVAVLVPTTVLCQQHLFTFRERFKEYPVLIEELSRFKTHGEQRQILEQLTEGKIDILIGTHRLLSEDVRFKDLGLMIVDEEQRFGVAHKERLKQMRANVDVLTMTATPIPRTLYLSMSGLRDMSTIVTPPLERLPVQTIVAQYSEDLIREAIRREIQRDGQVYFLHNRVKSIEQVAARLRELVPEADFDVGHGQMHEHELEHVMLRFMEGETDVLVCTTIIESGLDIPNANTIVIDRADRFGLAELYQLRGRVGRYHRQAYAYLFIPPHGMLVDNARKRLGAIRQYTQLGSGFRLALRDLEIRGAGNILGREQSGHIAAIGFDLYCQLLREAVSRMKGENTVHRPDVALICDFISFGPTTDSERVSACLPRDFITDEATRVACYRELSSFQEVDRVDAYQEELRDRFGRLPLAAVNFLMIVKMKITAANAGIHSISVRNRKVYLETRSGFLKNLNGRFPAIEAASPREQLVQLVQIVHRTAKKCRG